MGQADPLEARCGVKGCPENRDPDNIAYKLRTNRKQPLLTLVADNLHSIHLDRKRLPKAVTRWVF
jgi:hypothetical protein